jgi:hypothetical protein
MVKTLSNEEVTSSPNGTKKQRKKQARQEAKAMLRLERAKKNEQKAAKKANKAQAQLEAYRMRIHKIEARLAEIRTPDHDEPTQDTQGASPHGQEHQPGIVEALSSTSEQETSHGSSGNRATMSHSPDNEAASSSEGDDNTYTPEHSDVKSPFAEEGQ